MKRDRRADHDHHVQPELLVAHEHARPAADEPTVKEHEVHARQKHEQRDDPLGTRQRRPRSSSPVSRSRRSASSRRRAQAPRRASSRRPGRASRATRGAASARSSARRRGPRALVRSRGCALREPRSRGPGSSDSIICRPPTRRRGRMATARTMIPMPPSHCVNWRHMPERTREVVEVGDDARTGRRRSGHALEVCVDRVVELLAADEEVRERRERGRHEQHRPRRRGSPRGRRPGDARLP